MKFEIEGDGKKVLEGLKLFCEESEKVYKEELIKAKEKLKKIPLPVKVNIILPDEIPFVYMKTKQKNKYHLFIPIKIPIFQRLMKSPIKKMSENLKRFFQDRYGIKVKVKYLGD